jgi:hypothetical protein
MTIRLFILSLVSFAISSFGFAQSTLLKGVEDAAKKKVEAQDFNTTRSNRERNHYSGKESQQAEPPVAAPPASESAPTPVETPSESAEPLSSSSYQATYNFDALLTYSMESYKGDNVSKESITYLFGDQTAAFRIADKKMFMIYDPKNNSMVMIDEDKKTATVMPLSMFEQVMNGAAATKNTNESTITKTGNTKVILGYTCDEYTVVGETKSTIWITQTATGIVSTKNFADLFKNINPHSGSDKFNNEGLMLESITTDKDGKKQVHITATELKKTVETKNIGAYKITDISNMQR